ncbi:M24 family metallopeptidase [bacterium]|nr:M24 family metallopeptidase [bacterium]
MVNEKIKQASIILSEMGIDAWITFVRESSAIHDPALDLIFGSHVTWPAAFIIFADGKAMAIVGKIDAANVADHADYDIISYTNSIKDELIPVLEKNNPRRIAINYSVNDVTADGLTHGMYITLMEYLEDTPFKDRVESSETLMAALRGRKSKEEIRRITAAINETMRIFDEVTEFVKPGHSEIDVATFIKSKMEERGLSPAWDPEQCPAVFTGPESAGCHAGPTDRLIEPGHIMNIDFGVRVEGYVSDLQRTWYFPPEGEKDVPADVIKGFETIRDAIQKAAKAIQPGKAGWEIDKVARDYIVQRGYEEFPHGLGHQVGRQAHDGSALFCPRWDRYKNSPYLKVEKGQIFTIEPRLTVAGRGVSTLEEIIEVTENGCRFISRPQMDLWIVR